MDRYPPMIRDALDRLRTELEPLAPEPAALLVYGSYAKGTFREKESDVNVAVVLQEATPATLRALAGPLQRARRAAGVRPYLLVRSEIPRLADVFPIRVADMQAHHHLLQGADPFEGVRVTRGHLRLRAEQELRNHLLRFRRHRVFSGEDPLDLAKAVYGSVGPLAIELGALLKASGRPLGDPSAAAVLQAAAKAFDLDGVLLATLAKLRRGADIHDPKGLFDGVLALLERAVEIADRLVVAESEAAP